MPKVIEVSNLAKSYGKLNAVDGVSFSVQKGEVFGLLGENGAGKTTTLEIIEGLRRPTGGKIAVLGHDVQTDISAVKNRIGVQLQSSAYYSYLSLREILQLFGSFYKKATDPDELLAMVELQEKAGAFVTQLSGGQKQRFSIVASLVNDPEIVFLDEPTTGLDPVARRRLWDLIAKIKSQGKTIVLTTHYMEEAELLCDRVAIMEKGKIIAIDQTHRLVQSAKHPYKISFIAKVGQTVRASLERHGGLAELGGRSGHYQMALVSRNELNSALDIIRLLDPEALSVSQASLEDVFIELTGHGIDEREEDV